MLIDKILQYQTKTKLYFLQNNIQETKIMLHLFKNKELEDKLIMMKERVELLTQKYNMVSYHEIINRDELQSLQDDFCLVTGVMAYCVNEIGEKITQCSGNCAKIESLDADHIQEAVKDLLNRVGKGSLEEQVVEDLEITDTKIAAISIRIDDVPIITWVIFGVLSEDAHSLERFIQILDLLRKTSYVIFQDKVSCISAEAESRRSHFAEIEMIQNIRTIEATTEMVQLLDNNSKIEVTMNKFLNILGNYLKITSAQLLQVDANNEYMDIVVEWCNAEVASDFDKTKNIPTHSFLSAEKPLICSYDNIASSQYGNEFLELGINAISIFSVVKNDQGGGMNLCLIHKQKQHIWNMQEIKFMADAVKILQNIIQKRIQKNSLISSYEALEAILDNMGSSILVQAINDGSYLFANKKLKSIFDRELRNGVFQELIIHGIPIKNGTGIYEIRNPENGRWYDLFSTEIAWVDGRKASLYALHDITDKKTYQKKVEQQAYTDFLTGLFNRLCCERDLAWHIDEAKKNGEIGALLYLDLDDFKHINDGLGHQYGDLLLKNISRAFTQIKGISDTCYRMGGDEFVIIIPPKYMSLHDEIIENIKDIFSKPWYLKDADYYCTMSMGIVTFPEGGDSVEDLIKKADIAMYEAKKSGKNRCAEYSSKSDSISRRRLDMEKNLRDAMVEGYSEFEVYYQPIINVHENGQKCIGAEALIRWNSKELGRISPAEFIPLAEYLGLINPIGNHVLQEACKHCKYWNDNGYPKYKVNVNLSVVQLLQADIVSIIENALTQSQVTPENLTLEVTESLAINDMERMKEILNNIRKLGVKMALDDFGTGYSSLNHIREIPFDVIKVDQSFVKDLAEDAYSKSFIKLVAGLAETLGASICVEGVETLEQYEILQDMQIKYIQGYYIDHPMPKEDFEKKYTLDLSKG